LKKVIRLLILSSIFILCLFPIELSAQRLTIPSGAFYYQPASTVYGIESIWNNPAGLGRQKNSGFMIMLDYVNSDFGGNWAAAINREQFGLAYRKVDIPGDIDIKEIIISSGSKIGKSVTFGTNYRIFKDGPGDFDGLKQWEVGLSGRYRHQIRWAVIFSNLNRAKINGDRTETEMHYSLSYRPSGNFITIAADMFLSTKTKLSDADLIYHAEITPTKGLFINGFLGSDKSFQIGIRANLLKYITGTKFNYNSDKKHTHTTFYYGATDLKQESLIPEKNNR
jgi:hypothetical protein